MQDKTFFVKLNDMKTLDGLLYTKVTKVTDLKAKIFINYFVSVCAKCEMKHCYTQRKSQQRPLAVEIGTNTAKTTCRIISAVANTDTNTRDPETGGPTRLLAQLAG